MPLPSSLNDDLSLREAVAKRIHESVRATVRRLKGVPSDYKKLAQFSPWEKLLPINQEKYLLLADDLLLNGLPGFQRDRSSEVPVQSTPIKKFQR